MHESVLAEEVIEHLSVKDGGKYIDGTLGSGGHALRILERIGGDGILLGIDRDKDAIERAGRRLQSFGDMCILRQGNFAEMVRIAQSCGMNEVDGIVLDIGVSSDQLETAERGFSFMKDGPLDMRMDQGKGESAEHLVNELKKDELKKMIFELGEDRQAGRIADAIVREREKERIVSTARLAEVIEKAVGRRGRISPATKTFQALRIAVNGELEALETGLEAGLSLLKSGGRMAVISFHSLEDRIVKNCFGEHGGVRSSRDAGGSDWKIREPGVRQVTKKVLKPSQEEIDRNPRARSARLRVAEKL